MAIRKAEIQELADLRDGTRDIIGVSANGTHLMFIDRNTQRIGYTWIGQSAGKYLKALFEIVDREVPPQ